MSSTFLLLLTACLPLHSTFAFPNGTGNTVMFAPFLEAPISTIPSTFLSFNFDWNTNKTENDAWTNASFGWTLDLNNPHLEILASALAPANLRVGGSAADVAEYSHGFPNGGRNCSDYALANHFCLTPKRWDELVSFCQRTGLRLVFDLNIMLGRGDDGQNDWDSSNARALLQYTVEHHQEWATRENLAFELGNEKEFALSSLQAATSFLELRNMLDTTFAALSKNQRPMLVGPSMNIRTDWLTNFLNHLQSIAKAEGAASDSPTLDVIAYHMYPGYGRSVNLPSLIMRPAWLDFTHSVADQVRAAVLTSNSGVDLLSGTTELWIDETAAAWASGTAGVCNGFLSGFWYLDQLASVMTKGHSAMCRQCLVGGNYSLIEQRERKSAGGKKIPAWTPNPDWWTAWMWRTLVSGSSSSSGKEDITVLAVNQVMPYEGDYVPEARMYLVCTPKTSPHYRQGSVTSIWLNQDSNATKSLIMYQRSRFNVRSDGYGLQLSDSPAVPPSFANLPRFQYIMESSDGNLLSRELQVNSMLLSMLPGGKLPTFPIAEEAKVENMVVPSDSYGFAIYPNANASACM